MSSVLVISDMHLPYEHPDAFDFLRDCVKQVKPNVVVCIGDLVDFHSICFFDKNPEAWNAAEELRQIRSGAKAIDAIIGRKPRRLACYGNHEYRLTKRLDSAHIPEKLQPKLNFVLDWSEKWAWGHHHIVDDVFYNHGSRVGIVKRRSAAGLKGGYSCVYGHLHEQFGVWYCDDMITRRWIASAGCLVDRRTPVLKYSWEYDSMPVLGTLAVIDNTPIQLPMSDASVEKTRYVDDEEAARMQNARIISAANYLRSFQYKTEGRNDPVDMQRYQDEEKAARESKIQGAMK